MPYQRTQTEAKEYENIALAKPYIFGPLQDLGIDLKCRGHYVGILASRDTVKWPKDLRLGHHVAVLKGSHDGGNPLGSVLSRKFGFRTPFEGHEARVEGLRSNREYRDASKREKEWHRLAQIQIKLREEADKDREVKRMREGPAEISQEGRRKSARQAQNSLRSRLGGTSRGRVRPSSSGRVRSAQSSGGSGST